MFYLFRDTEQYRAEWLSKKDRQGDLGEYYINRRFQDVYGVEPVGKEKDALAYLARITKGAYRRWTAKGSAKGKTRWLYECWCRALKELAAELKEPGTKSGRHMEILLDFLERDFSEKAMRIDDDREAEAAMVRLVGRCRRIRLMHDNGQKKTGREETVKNARWNAEEMQPRQIKAYLDRFIIGQEDAKRTISAAVYAHGVRLRHPKEKFPGNTVLLIGPSGCGKTEIMRRIRELTGLPVAFTDVSTLAPAQWGYKRQIEDVLLMLYEAADGDMERAECGIVFMDEFDKLLQPMFSAYNMDMSQEIQAQMLTILEGSSIELKYGDSLMMMDTSNILFVLAGAFSGISEYIHTDKLEKIHASGHIGFGGVPALKEWDRITKANINHEVLISYGMKRELAGRISQVAVMEQLSEEALIRILTEAEDNMLARYQREAELICGTGFIMGQDVIRRIAGEVREDETGARALYGKLRELFRDMLYELPDRKCVDGIEIRPDKTVTILGDMS
ncbi:MAG: AAA family ATPase [Lachnospiraceae bacterium]|nr:AAA family ATPase [Lachnospiraceae bacterium]